MYFILHARSFNLPYQLGYSGNVDYGGSFENPIDADTGDCSE